MFFDFLPLNSPVTFLMKCLQINCKRTGAFQLLGVKVKEVWTTMSPLRVSSLLCGEKGRGGSHGESSSGGINRERNKRTVTCWVWCAPDIMMKDGEEDERNCRASSTEVKPHPASCFQLDSTTNKRGQHGGWLGRELCALCPLRTTCSFNVWDFLICSLSF